jgi:uncharacterized YkwD family protein
LNKKYCALLLGFAVSLSMSACTTWNASPPNGLGNPKSMISASYEKADVDYTTLTSDVTAKGGTDGASPSLYKLTNGTTVRVLGKINNYYVVMPSNNRVGLIPIANTEPTPQSNPQTVPDVPGSAGDGMNAEESTMLGLVNSARTANGLKPLSSNSQLTKVARLKSQDLAKNNYFSHMSPTYGSPFDMMKKYGISYLYAGENLAKNSNVTAAETSLMNSPAHKKNILNPEFNQIGIGVAASNDGSKIYTQMFIGR